MKAAPLEPLRPPATWETTLRSSNPAPCHCPESGSVLNKGHGTPSNDQARSPHRRLSSAADARSVAPFHGLRGDLPCGPVRAAAVELLPARVHGDASAGLHPELAR